MHLQYVWTVEINMCVFVLKWLDRASNLIKVEFLRYYKFRKKGNGLFYKPRDVFALSGCC